MHAHLAEVAEVADNFCILLGIERLFGDAVLENRGFLYSLFLGFRKYWCFLAKGIIQRSKHFLFSNI